MTIEKVFVFVVFITANSVAVCEMLINDPSGVSITTELGISDRYRILGDFNVDGIEDMAISADMNQFGSGGGEFTIYLCNAGGEYRKYGTFWSHPAVETIAIEKWGQNISLWTYSHLGGGTGSIGYYGMGEKGMSDRSSIIIHPGDSGTAMGNALVESVFKNSDVVFKLERSTTRDGKVEWK